MHQKSSTCGARPAAALLLRLEQRGLDAAQLRQLDLLLR
jgi:hypothetical protein